MTKYMLIMRADERAAAAYATMPFEEVIAAMGRYNESMMNAGVLLTGDGLSDASEGAVVDFEGETPLVTDGPYGELRELFNGFWMIETATKEEAIEWAKRAPLTTGNFIEVRRVNGVEDFPQDNEWIQKQAGWREEQEQRAAQG
ncbi:YciI family protein [Agromyces protaetiae]|uniref:YciI family protein n=1 Tax=Agromyces protaetiae TaxID=2509455 RepID=A0A4P6FB59_9MICO|nr:YciI family protein [Agromyces protaetiae]QAY73212.1 YciI family protein [Agromyces protaetiae]